MLGESSSGEKEGGLGKASELTRWMVVVVLALQWMQQLEDHNHMYLEAIDNVSKRR